LKKNSVAKSPGNVLVAGIIIFITTVLVWSIGYIPYYQEAGPMFWVLVGLLLIFHGLIGVFKTPESFILDITVNGKQLSHTIPLRLVLVTVANTSIGIAGVISMSMVHQSGWNTFGLILSILLLLWVLVSILLKQKPINMDFQKIKVSSEAMKKSEKCCGEFLGHLVQVFNGLLPLPSISSLTNIGQVLQQPRKVTNKPVHILLLVLAMVICVVMFFAQIWVLAIRDCDGTYGLCFFVRDPEDYFARRWENIFFNWVGFIAARNIIILTSAPITFLFCTVLILMMKNTTVLRMLLFSLTTFIIGTFFLVFSICSVQYLIMMGVKIPLLFKLLTLVTLLPVPLLAAVFMALAYSTLVQVWVQKENESSSSSKTCYLTFFTILSVVFIFFSLFTMTLSIQVVTTNTQEHWNSTSNHGYDEECRDKEYRDRYSSNYDYYRTTTTTTTTTVAPVEKPEKCYGKTLDYDIQQMMAFFSISQEFVTESVMFFGLFVFLTGKRITKKSLFIHGILLLASTISTCIAFFNVMDKEKNFLRDGETSSLSQENIFLILNCINAFAPFIVGFICLLLGASCIISFLEFLFRTILSLLVFVCILFLSPLQLLLLLASNLATSKMPHYSPWMSNDEPEVINA